MVRLDSIKIQVRDDCIDRIDNNFIKDEIDRHNINGEIFDQIKVKRIIPESKILGLKDIKFLNTGLINIELSAKIFKENYPGLINQNNIEYMVDCLNKNKAVQFNKRRLIETASVLYCDCTQNLEVSRNKQEYFKALFELKTNTKYNVIPYIKKGIFETIIFEKNIRNKRSNSFERLIVYDKYQELVNSINKNKQDENKELVNKYLKMNGLDWFANKLRFERRFNHFENIRKSFLINDNYLNSVLTSPENVILKLFEEINRGSKTGLFDIWKNEDKFYSIIKTEGFDNIIEKCNYDIEIIKHFIKQKVKGNSSAYVRKFKDRINFLMNKSGNISNNYIDEIIELIKAA